MKYQRRVFDVLENATLAGFGEAETVLPFLSHYQTYSYTYNVSANVSRGERPDPTKLAALKEAGFAGTINLCKEMSSGDLTEIREDHLENGMWTLHIPIVDMTPPTPAQVMHFLSYIADKVAQGERLYVHCEAGKGRTGVVIACYRMGALGWSMTDARTEAKNFGCSVPDQIAFIEHFGAALSIHHELKGGGEQSGGGLGNYPLKALGSVTPTPEELMMTLAEAAHGTESAD